MIHHNKKLHQSEKQIKKKDSVASFSFLGGKKSLPSPSQMNLKLRCGNFI
jgi:hypothetical protein